MRGIFFFALGLGAIVYLILILSGFSAMTLRNLTLVLILPILIRIGSLRTFIQWIREILRYLFSELFRFHRGSV
ncbi:MAG TPA: hypothetical protein PK590_07495, partial [Candidatus Omnitrophota bacterium]|nr:hypothetical protein [Candidatus Omnitrophota bacterium]